MAEKVSLTYQGGQGPSVDVLGHVDVQVGASIEVSAEEAKGLLEQEANWTLTKVEKPKDQSEKDGK